MKKEAMQAVLQKIKEYDRIIITRHVRPDGDAIGSTKGLWKILQLSFPQKEIYLLNEDQSEYLEFLGGESEPIDAEKYADALCIVLDTGNVERISNKKYSLCRELVKIDHHIDHNPYGDVSWVETHRSSVCEMVAAFYAEFADELKIDTEAATCLYAGMVTDSGRFRYDSTSGDTLRLGGLLLDQGINTEVLFSNLYLKEFEMLKFEAYIYDKMHITENGVAYVYVDREMQEKFRLSQEDASAAVSYMDAIKGALCWIAFIDNPGEDTVIRVRLRSRFVTINTIAENHNGGGHACASGATVYSLEEMQQVIAEADARVKEYKETHEGWL
ncbi:MAG: bifunctional oligoribonuclease/PAP phosphatase NrnA [Ruminococcaceae bacterium]|nr:bifunctional oligoribonuclease/PAP phosphatase NrnA [Oscillospiraceae bacterium]